MKKLCVGLLISSASIVGVHGSVVIDANLFNSANHFGASGNQAYAFFNVSIENSEFVSAEIRSPSGSITGGTEGSSSSSFFSFEALRSEIHGGSWTLTLGRDTGESEPVLSDYQFEVDISGLDAPQSFSILNPANGATDVTPGPTLFQWTAPLDVYATQGVDLSDVTSFLSRSTYATIPIEPTDSSFEYGAPGLDESRRYLFFVQYSKDVTGEPNVSISVPMDEFGPLDEFTYSIGLHNEAETIFTTVPEPGAWAVISGLGLTGLIWVRRGRRSACAS